MTRISVYTLYSALSRYYTVPAIEEAAGCLLAGESQPWKKEELLIKSPIFVKNIWAKINSILRDPLRSLMTGYAHPHAIMQITRVQCK